MKCEKRKAKIKFYLLSLWFASWHYKYDKGQFPEESGIK